MISGVVARRGIQAIQLTHENRYKVTDLVQGRLRQRARLDSALGYAGYSFELAFTRDGREWSVKEHEWILLSPQGFVAIMDAESFDAWFETVALSDAVRPSPALGEWKG